MDKNEDNGIGKLKQTKRKKPKTIRVLNVKDDVKLIEVDTPFKKKKGGLDPSLQKPMGPKTKGMKGVRIAKRGGGRAYGKNS